MKHVHIVGIAPRAGTTLMLELMVRCFDFCAYADHEASVFVVPDRPVARYCSKSPKELAESTRALGYNADLWVICLLRDPRDVIVSRHGKQPKTFWSDLSGIEGALGALRRARGHPRFMLVRYEDLVADPDAVQDRIADRMRFLTRKARFSQFEDVADPTVEARLALGGVRPISTASVGGWRRELPRVKAQDEMSGRLCDILVELGYEPDGAWSAVLDTVRADNGPPRRKKHEHSVLRRGERLVKARLREFLYRIGHPATRRVIHADRAAGVNRARP
jgi:hypothetical protein